MYKITIGLEIHVELNTKIKIFCSCKNNSDEKDPNVNICPICMGHPGTLPVINKEAVKKVIKTGLALNCDIATKSKFDRKNYFYPDLPKGYQISQYDYPLCKNGYLEINNKKIRIRRIHLEEDTGKLLHFEGENYSLVDFNRAGVPLMELVTEPDIESGEEARKFAEEFQLILRYIGVSEANMEKGEMRVEVNISLAGKDKSGKKVEIKNLNSFRVVEKAIDFEIERQSKILDEGKEVIQETRGWHDKKEITFSQREKEEAHDYRYFPEPDLPYIEISQDYIKSVRAEIPELPNQKRKRFFEEYELDKKMVEIFILNKDLSEYFEKVISEIKAENALNDYRLAYKIAANYITSDLLGLFNGDSFSEERCLITPENFADFIILISKGEISSKIAKQILSEMFKTGKDPLHIIKDSNLSQINSEDEIEKIIKEVILENQKAVDDYKNGKESSFQFLIGKIMAKTKGRANPQLIHKILKKQLS